eukprot:CAMPEP_0185157558 /NCGR_PEP_ID=MMETSP1139-20130426/1849_1 /TAXON_ID=298111 /ORGANISM="Pavlova sp., Strain CCMP459" /LENGTH=51 /DNA_ID=CAMNT_0027722647 /DNA_START=155 /DNA_END=308 /DNA_ORIENTATION=-
MASRLRHGVGLSGKCEADHRLERAGWVDEPGLRAGALMALEEQSQALVGPV